MRTSLTPRDLRHNVTPATADREQAAVTAQLLAKLIHESGDHLAAAERAIEIALRAGDSRELSRLRAQAKALRLELSQLRSMDDRLALRFQETGALPA